MPYIKFSAEVITADFQNYFLFKNLRLIEQDCGKVFPAQLVYEDNNLKGFVWQHVTGLVGDRFVLPFMLKFCCHTHFRCAFLLLLEIGIYLHKFKYGFRYKYDNGQPFTSSYLDFPSPLTGRTKLSKYFHNVVTKANNQSCIKPVNSVGMTKF